MSASPAGRLSCRQIAAADLPAITDLLHAGFPKRPRGYWVTGLRHMAARAAPPGCPQYGYLLQAGSEVVGVLLLIFSARGEGEGAICRGNMSSWYVRPDFRAYAPLLVLRGIRHPAATYLNISPAPETLPIIAAQGFRPFSRGVFAALPLLARGGTAVRLRTRWDDAALPQEDARLLRDHAAFGCLALWCADAEGGQPLILRRRRIRPGGIPCAQLIYCRSPAALAAMAAPLGRFLARHGMPLLLIAGNGPLAGVPGRFFADRLPMYCKGAEAPPGDLSYTEAALFGL